MRPVSAILSTAFALTAAAATVQLLPFGEFSARDGRPGIGKTWKLGNAEGEALAAQLNATLAANEMVIDYDHQTLHVAEHGQKAPAAGWVNKVEWLDGRGLFGQRRWTPAAERHIADGEYRYISPVISYDEDSGQIQDVFMAALVNFPGLSGMQPVLSQLATQFHNRPSESQSMNEVLKALLLAIGVAETATKDEAMTALAAHMAPAKAVLAADVATALGVPATADSVAVLAAVQKLRGTGQATVAEMSKLQQQVAALSGALAARDVAALVAQGVADGKLLPAQEPWATSLGKSDLAALTAFLAGAPKIAGLSGQTRGDHDKQDKQSEPAVLAKAALAYQVQQAAAGNNITTVEAVEAVSAIAAKSA